MAPHGRCQSRRQAESLGHAGQPPWPRDSFWIRPRRLGLAALRHLRPRCTTDVGAMTHMAPSDPPRTALTGPMLRCLVVSGAPEPAPRLCEALRLPARAGAPWERAGVRLTGSVACCRPLFPNLQAHQGTRGGTETPWVVPRPRVSSFPPASCLSSLQPLLTVAAATSGSSARRHLQKLRGSRAVGSVGGQGLSGVSGSSASTGSGRGGCGLRDLGRDGNLPKPWLLVCFALLFHCQGEDDRTRSAEFL